ncbi:hypothetical protein QR680_002573 [Steinernema hermaphroditum]|uniref:Uncharacterized protein n=1 Tax=Steinernema hermaphroditum TaxID=289476 RepID=A0AA39H5B4_9BILA|nr:hypothetical protein QR680_002573 [Steinernema hermaphroditum]
MSSQNGGEHEANAHYGSGAWPNTVVADGVSEAGGSAVEPLLSYRIQQSLNEHGQDGALPPPPPPPPPPHLQAYYDAAFVEFEQKFGRFCTIEKQYIRLDEHLKLNAIESFHAAGANCCVNTNLHDGRLVDECDPDGSMIEAMFHMCCPNGFCRIEEIYSENAHLFSAAIERPSQLDYAMLQDWCNEQIVPSRIATPDFSRQHDGRQE